MNKRMGAAMTFTVVLSRRPAAGRWRTPVTALAGILPPREASREDDDGGDLLRDGAGVFAFDHVPLTLQRDLCESYWANVSGDSPRLFVVCREADGAPCARPILVTAAGDEAAGHAETDDLTFAAPMPAAARELVEKFVMDNYFPEPKRKRKRE